MDSQQLIEKVKYYATQTFLKHVLLAFGILFLMTTFVFISLNIYTSHGNEITVPDLNGLKLSEIEEVIDDNDLRFEITDSVYYIDRVRGTVIEQNPPANFKVKKDRTIFITINATQTQMVRVPNVTNVSLVQAKSDLETEGLFVGNLNYIPDIATNYVLMQKFKGKEIEAGELVPKGSAIDLTLGKDIENEESTYIPSLFGLKKKEALAKGTDFYLNIGSVVYDRSIKTLTDTLNAKVWKQSPEASRNVPVGLGSNINIWLTVDKKKLTK